MQVSTDTGYKHPRYAESLTEFGTPRELPHCGGWILQRRIPGFPNYDGMGCYPLFACQKWSQLSADLEEIGNDLVSLSLVADPIGAHEHLAHLQSSFDIMVPFKEHFLVDLHKPMNFAVSKHHRRYAMNSLQNVSVVKLEDPTQLIDDWTDLYSTLIQRHNLRGIKAFSRTAFMKQLSIPGTVVFRAMNLGTTVGADWYYVQNEAVYGHLAALSADGYRLRASYALLWRAIEYFGKNENVRWLDLGGGAGVESTAKDGLSMFKRGWSTETRTAYFCGRIFDRERYEMILRTKGIPATTYFPAYRRGEFA